jgi:hypothetical protein
MTTAAWAAWAAWAEWICKGTEETQVSSIPSSSEVKLKGRLRAPFLFVLPYNPRLSRTAK